MNLKEAFRFQNKLQGFMNEAEEVLKKDANITTQTQTALRHKIMAEAEDETATVAPETEFASQITELTQFLMYLLSEKEKLCKAIYTAKAALPIDMDSEVSLNATRQSIAKTFAHMNDLRGSEVTVPHGGVGYRFNVEGNQVSYRCDLKKVTKINYDRNVIRASLAKLNSISDQTSTMLYVSNASGKHSKRTWQCKPLDIDPLLSVQQD